MIFRSLWRTRQRGLPGTLRQTLFHLGRFRRYSTPGKIVNVALAKGGKLLRRDRLRSLPYRYTIDPTNACNLRCPLCPTGLGILKRDRGQLSLPQFQALVDQIAPVAYLVELYNWGEPFLHNHIFEMIRYAHDRRMMVRLSSNLNHFNPAMAQKTVEAGLDALTVSIDGATQETYERYRRKGDLDTVMRNLGYLLDARRAARATNPLITVRLLVNRYNESEVAAVRDRVLDLGVDLFAAGDLFVDTTDPAQRQEWLPADPANSAYHYEAPADDIENVWHCSDLWESMTINWDGGVSPCCWLHDARNDFANVFEQSIREIWNGDAYRAPPRLCLWWTTRGAAQGCMYRMPRPSSLPEDLDSRIQCLI